VFPVRLHFTFILAGYFSSCHRLGSNQSALTYTLLIVGLGGVVAAHEWGHALVGLVITVSGPSKCHVSHRRRARWERPAKPKEMLDRLGRSLRERTDRRVIFEILFQHRRSDLYAFDQPSDSKLWIDRAGNLILAGFNLLPRFPWMAAACCERFCRVCVGVEATRNRPPGRDACWPSAWDSSDGLSAAAGLRGILHLAGCRE